MSLLGCRAPADPELHAREQYTQLKIQLEDAGAKWPLTSRSTVTFGPGFWPQENLEGDAGLAWRWAGPRAELRLHAVRAGRHDLRLRGWGSGAAGFAQSVEVRVNGSVVGHFETRDRYDERIPVAADGDVGTRYVVQFESKHPFVLPDDGRSLGFAVSDVTWESSE